MSERIVIGSQVLLFVNGAPWGNVVNFRFTSDAPVNAIHALDSPEAYEISSTTTSVSGSISLYRMIGDGGLEGSGLTARFEDIVRMKYVNLALRERFSDTVIFQCRNCVISNQSWGAEAKGMMMGSFNFSGISWSNEINSNRS